MKKQEYRIHKYVVVGYSPDGKQIRKHIYANTDQELRKVYAKLLEEYSGIRNPSDITFSEYAKKWQKAYNSQKSVATKNYYQTGIDKLDAIGSKRLKNVTRTDCQEIINVNYDKPRTCQKLSRIMSAIFDAALADGIVKLNPAKKLTIPRYHAPERRPFTDVEIKAIKKAELDVRQRLAVDLFFYFGLRPEELRALMKSDFDLTKKDLTINKAITFDGNTPVLAPTKNRKERIVPIPDILIPKLRTYLAKLDTLYLFVGKNANVMTKSAWRRFSEPIFSEINRQLGGDETFNMLNGMTWYTFRHNHGTQLYYMTGISTKKKAYLMGHSEPIFISTYSHLEEDKEDLTPLRKLNVN